MRKKILLVCVISLVFSSFRMVNYVKADEGCSEIDGASIIGQTINGYKYLGSIANPYNIDSVADEFGKGSQYNINSLFDEYGTFGSQFSNYSAFNDYATRPPFLIDRNWGFLGFVTVEDGANSYNTYNPYEVLACAQQSYAFPIQSQINIGN
jgi:hypothetical protein